jgi:alpha-L-fucosidase 2
LHEIHLLPALPSAWSEGCVRGLRARGGFELVELAWREGRLVTVTIRSHLGGACVVRVGTLRATFATSPGQVLALGAELQ